MFRQMTDTDVLYYADGDKAIIAATVAVQDARDARISPEIGDYQASIREHTRKPSCGITFVS